MWIPTISTILIVVAAALLVLGTLPMKNELKDNTLTVKFVIGKKVIDMTDAKFYPVPDEVQYNLIRVGGTSAGKKRSGNFVSIRTKTRYQLYLTGNGEKSYFVIGDKKYLVDGISSTRYE